MGHFFKYDKTFASDQYLIYKLSPSARVCISDTDRLLMLYLVLKESLAIRRRKPELNHGTKASKELIIFN